MSRSRSFALIAAAVLTASLAPVVTGLVPAALGTPQPNLHAEGMHGIVHAKGAGAIKSGAANMTWHNGSVMNSADVTPIFWGTSWATHTGDKIVGIDAFYEGVGGTTYMNTNTEYTGLNGSKVTNAVTSRRHLVNGALAGSKAPTTAAVLAAVADSLANAAQKPVANGYYPVYSDIKRGSAGYCAWHSYGTIGGVAVQFGFFFDLDGDSGCSVGAYGTHPTTGGFERNSAGLSALANVSGHELSEAVTDPRNGGWYDRQGAENSDKCAWTFGTSLITFPGNGSTWRIQGNWSNAAYTA